MATQLEDLLADISSVARRPSEAKAVVQPPVLREIEVSELDVVEELPALEPKRLARGTEPAANEVGLIDLERMRSAEYAEMAVAAQPAERRQRRRRNTIGALLLVLGAAVGAGAMAAWPVVSQRSAGSAEEPERVAAPVEVASATPAEVAAPAQAPVEQEEFVAVDELEPGEIEIDFPVMAIKPRAAAVHESEEAPAPSAPLSLEAPCYEAACAAMDEAADDDEDDTADEGDETAEADEESAAEEAEAPAAPAPPPVDPRTLPAHPHASVIATAIVAVQDQLDGCGDAFGTHGAVRVKLRITPAGTVESVTVLDGSSGFRSCVADAVRRVRVNASTLGTTETMAIRVH